MLKQLRSGSKNIFVKGLLILVALSFVAWGVGDMFRAGSARNVATIGDTAISFEQYNDVLQREISRYSQLFGKQLGEAEIAALGLRQQVASQMVQEELLSQRARDLELQVGRDVVYQRIANTPIFNDETGKFNKDTFRQVLRENGLTESRYVESLSNDMALGFLVSAFIEAEPSINVLAEKLYQAKHEKRVVDLLVIPASHVSSVPKPSEEELQAFYEKNEAQFTVPEMRDISYALLTSAIIEDELTFSDEQLREYYDANRARYETGEVRDVSQYLFDSKEEADEAYQALKVGEKASVESVSLGSVTRDNLPANVGDAVFSIAKGEYSAPTESDLGWHIFQITKVKESVVTPFAEVKEKIRTMLLSEQGEDLFYSTTNQMEDDIAAGMNLDELAEKYNFTVKTAEKLKSRDNKMGDVEQASSLVAFAFAAGEGELSSLMPLESGEGYAVLVVNNIHEKQVKPLEVVKAEAVDAWQTEKKQTMLKDLANELASQVTQGAEIAKLASVPGLSFLPQRPFSKPTNGSADSKYPQAFVKRLFALKPAETTNAYRMADGGYVIGRLQEVVESEKARVDDEEGYAAVEQEIKENYNNELMEVYFAYLETVYPVEINHGVLAPDSE